MDENKLMPDNTPFDLVTSWEWTPTQLHVNVVAVTGGDDLPPDVVRAIQTSCGVSLEKSDGAWVAADRLVNQLGTMLAMPPEFTMPDGRTVKSAVINLDRASSRQDASPLHVVARYTVQRTLLGMTYQDAHIFRADTMSQTQVDEALEIHRLARQVALSRLGDVFGGGEFNPEKWVAIKTAVFLSYRGRAVEHADTLAKGLGEFDDRRVFRPTYAKVDMQAGDWITQLETMIAQCPVFIPILTKDYLDGPWSRPEFHNALRRYQGKGDKRIIPVVVEGRPEDYAASFLGNLHMVQAQGGTTPEVVKEVAYLALGISRNPYA